MHRAPEMAVLLAAAWFSSAVLIQVGGTALLLRWLRRHGATVLTGFAGTPGYLEVVYLRLCRVEGRHPTKLLAFRVASVVNLIAAALCSAPLLWSR